MLTFNQNLFETKHIKLNNNKNLNNYEPKVQITGVILDGGGGVI